MIKYADLHKEYRECHKAVDAAIARCIANSSFINGPEVLAFEQAWADYTQSKYCAGVSSGTSALMLALSAVGVTAGDEVIVPSMSFISTAEVVTQLGAVPVFVDIDQYHTIDIDQVSDAISPKTKAIIFVDLYGQTIDIDALKRVSGRIPLIEDAAQSSVCTYKTKRIGSLVDATCYSFYPGKNLSAIGDAGAVTSNNQAVIDRIKMLRDHGRTEKYLHVTMGWNERLDGLQAAVVGAKIDWLEEWNFRRQERAAVYKLELANLAEVTLPKTNPASSHVYNQFVIQCDDRNELREYLLKHNIETGIQFPLAMHQQPVYAQLGYILPRSEELARTCLSLPVHAQMSIKDVETVCKAIKQFYHTDFQSIHVTTPT